MCKTWPSIDDLRYVGGSRIRIPSALQSIIEKRYEEHGMEYATEEMHLESGVETPINGCVQANTLQDIEEELVDAAFNVLVLRWKVGIRSEASLFWDEIISLWYKFQLLKEGEPIS